MSIHMPDLMSGDVAAPPAPTPSNLKGVGEEAMWLTEQTADQLSRR
jgi:hypothetical protein